MPTVIRRFFKGQRPAPRANGGLGGLLFLARLLREPSPQRRCRLAARVLRAGGFAVALVLETARDAEEEALRVRPIAGGTGARDPGLLLEALGSRVSPLLGMDPARPRWAALHEDPFRPGCAFLRKFNLACLLILPLQAGGPGEQEAVSQWLLLAADEPHAYASPVVQEVVAVWSLYRMFTAEGRLAAAAPDAPAPPPDGLAGWPPAALWAESPAALALLEGQQIAAANPAAQRLLAGSVGADGQAWRTWLAAAGRRLIEAGREADKLPASQARELTLEVRLGGHVEGGGGRSARVLAVRDASEEVLAERRSAEAISTISHELRTPLTSMKNSVGLLLRGEAGEPSPQARNFLTMTMRNIDRLNRLISDLLDVSRAAAGRLDLHRQTIDLVPLLQEALEIFAATARQRRIALSCDCGPDSFPAHVDGDKVVQMIHNTVGNALKYTPEGGRVRVWLNPRPGDGYDLAARAVADRFFLPLRVFALVVEDNGVGMSEQVRRTLFQPFARGDERAAASEPGTGLGLHITRALVEAHGGRISLASGAGAGTTVWIVLPRDPESERVLVASRRLRARQMAGGRVALLDARGGRRPEDGAQLRRAARAVREFLARLEGPDAAAAGGPPVEEPADGLWGAVVGAWQRLAAAWEVERSRPGAAALLEGTAWELFDLPDDPAPAETAETSKGLAASNRLAVPETEERHG